MKLIVDVHEPRSIKEYFFNDANTTFLELEVGDYAIGEYIIERKTYGDFASAIVDGRLHSQRYRLTNCNKKPIIVLVGFTLPQQLSFIKPEAILTAKADILSHGISVVHVSDDLDFVHLIEKFVEKHGTEWISPIEVYATEDVNLKLWTCVPMLGEARARQLAKMYSFFDIPSLKEEDFTKVKGIGSGLAKRIMGMQSICKK